jgi:phenylalanyl-tRNA synthetase alpha chain
MQNQLDQLKVKTFSELNQVKDFGAFKNLEIKILGRKGELAEMLRRISGLSEVDKKNIGTLANNVKIELAGKFEAVKNTLLKASPSNKFVDVTIPGEKITGGHLHPITIIQNDLEDLFTSLGFMIADGPELESDYYNFEAINIPRHHPARDMQDTFYICDANMRINANDANCECDYDMVMRTHTSSVQVRTMQKYGAPLKAVAPGRVFRSEATDVRHEHTFPQFEGFMIGEKIAMSDMMGVLELVGKHLYGENTKLRLRPKFYPFVEPGVNGEYTCFLCQGRGCRLCKNTGWLEVIGAGMIHPNVLIAGGIDPKKYQGFAFGYGLSRLVQLKYGIEDTRLFNSGDLKFLNQF